MAYIPMLFILISSAVLFIVFSVHWVLHCWYDWYNIRYYNKVKTWIQQGYIWLYVCLMFTYLMGD